jgi:hypothetical protein
VVAGGDDRGDSVTGQRRADEVCEHRERILRLTDRGQRGRGLSRSAVAFSYPSSVLRAA